MQSFSRLLRIYLILASCFSVTVTGAMQIDYNSSSQISALLISFVNNCILQNVRLHHNYKPSTLKDIKELQECQQSQLKLLMNDPTMIYYSAKNCPNIMAIKLHYWKQIEDYVKTTSNAERQVTAKVKAMLNTICRFYPTREVDKIFRRLTVICFVNKLIAELANKTSRILLKGFPYATLFPFNTFETSLDLILLGVNQLQPDYFGNIDFCSLFRLLAMMFRLPGMLSEDRNRNSTIELLRDRVTSNRLEIILTKGIEEKYYWNEEYLATVRLLLEAGANPNIGLDGVGNAPLYLVARWYDQVLSEAITSLLVEFGAHVDRVNKAGQTATDIWIETRNQNGSETGWNARPDWCRTVPKLLCLASRVIRVHKIPYTSGKIPAILHPFVAMH